MGWRMGPGKKRGGAFSPLFEDRVHAMTLPIFKTPKQKKKKKSVNDSWSNKNVDQTNDLRLREKVFKKTQSDWRWS